MKLAVSLVIASCFLILSAQELPEAPLRPLRVQASFNPASYLSAADADSIYRGRHSWLPDSLPDQSAFLISYGSDSAYLLLKVGSAWEGWEVSRYDGEFQAGFSWGMEPLYLSARRPRCVILRRLFFGGHHGMDDGWHTEYEMSQVWDLDQKECLFAGLTFVNDFSWEATSGDSIDGSQNAWMISLSADEKGRLLLHCKEPTMECFSDCGDLFFESMRTVWKTAVTFSHP